MTSHAIVAAHLLLAAARLSCIILCGGPLLLLRYIVPLASLRMRLRCCEHTLPGTRAKLQQLSGLSNVAALDDVD